MSEKKGYSAVRTLTRCANVTKAHLKAYMILVYKNPSMDRITFSDKKDIFKNPLAFLKGVGVEITTPKPEKPKSVSKGKGKKK